MSSHCKTHLYTEQSSETPTKHSCIGKRYKRKDMGVKEKEMKWGLLREVMEIAKDVRAHYCMTYFNDFNVFVVVQGFW